MFTLLIFLSIEKFLLICFDRCFASSGISHVTFRFSQLELLCTEEVPASLVLMYLCDKDCFSREKGTLISGRTHTNGQEVGDALLLVICSTLAKLILYVCVCLFVCFCLWEKKS